jgi:outer membrane protein
VKSGAVRIPSPIREDNGMRLFSGSGRRTGVLLPVLLIILFAPGIQAQERTLDLDEAIRRALERSPSLAQTEASLISAQQGKRTATGAFLPRVSASGSASKNSSTRYNEQTQTTVEGSSESYSGGLSGSLSLWEGGARGYELAMARADLAGAEASLEDQRNNVIYQTKNLYFAALRQADLLEVNQRRVEQAEESLAMVRTMAQVGTGTTSDTLRALLELNNALQSVLQSSNAVRAARFALGRQVGLGGPVAPVLPGTLDPQPLALSESEIFELAEEASAMVRAAEASADAAEIAVKSARAAYWPTLSMSSGYSWSNSEPSLSNGNTSWNLRLSGSYSIFNGFNREASVVRSENQSRVAQLQEADARLQIRELVDGALQTVRTNEQAIALAEEGLVVAEEDLRVIRERFRLGVATSLDLVISQISLRQADVDVVLARYDFALAKADLEALIGRAL